MPGTFRIDSGVLLHRPLLPLSWRDATLRGQTLELQPRKILIVKNSSSSLQRFMCNLLKGCQLQLRMQTSRMPACAVSASSTTT